MIYKVVLHESEEGFSINCWSQGATEAEALENIGDAIREYRAAIDDLFSGDDVRHVEVQPVPRRTTD
jgi:predicted RNase H-like HicB family nuclease